MIVCYLCRGQSCYAAEKTLLTSTDLPWSPPETAPRSSNNFEETIPIFPALNATKTMAFLPGLKKQFNKANQFMSERITGVEGTKLDNDFQVTMDSLSATALFN